MRLDVVGKGPPPTTYPRWVLDLRNFAYYATIPVNLALIVWVWIGRVLVGSGGWWILIFLVSVVPVLIVALTVTTVLAMLQRQPKSTGRLTVPQFWALIGVWVSLFGFGLFIVDFGDSTDSYSSAFSQLFGRGVIDVSNALSGVFFVLSLCAWVALLVLLIIGMQGRAERKAFEQSLRVE